MVLRGIARLSGFALTLAATAASAAAFALYARVEWPWVLLGWCGLVPWLVVLDRTPRLGAALASAVLMCELFSLAVFFWFARAIGTYTGAPLGVGLAVLVLIAPVFLQPQFLLFAVVRHLARRSGAGPWRIALSGACAYVGAEWACPKLFADTIGHGLYASPLLRQAADLAGAPGLTFVVLIGNECLLAALRAASAAASRAAIALPVAGLALLIGAQLGYGSWRYMESAGNPPPGAVLRVGIVQGNLSHYGRLAAELGTYDAARLILDTYFALSQDVLETARRPGVDLLVWPETVYPTTFGTPKTESGAELDRAIAAFVDDAGTPLIFGSYDVDDGAEFNAAVLLEPSADERLVFDAYRKASLFPLTERVPALLDLPALRRWLPWLGTWTPGDGQRVLPLRLRDGRTVRVAPLICYDAVDPHLALDAARQGAELIVTLSNDAWFATGGGPRLHLVVSAFRSIETRLPQVRATNTGISAVIAPTGDLYGTIPVDERGTLAATIAPTRGAHTLMLAWGNWFPPTAAALALLAASVVGRRGGEK